MANDVIADDTVEFGGPLPPLPQSAQRTLLFPVVNDNAEETNPSINGECDTATDAITRRKNERVIAAFLLVTGACVLHMALKALNIL